MCRLRNGCVVSLSSSRNNLMPYADMESVCSRSMTDHYNYSCAWLCKETVERDPCALVLPCEMHHRQGRHNLCFPR